MALGALTVAGAVYLIWLGVGALRHPAHAAAAKNDGTATSWRAQALKGAGISGLNVKGLILFLALLPAYAVADAAVPLTVQIVIFGLVHVVSCAVVYTAVGVAARRVRSLARAVSRFSGAAMIHTHRVRDPPPDRTRGLTHLPDRVKRTLGSPPVLPPALPSLGCLPSSEGGTNQPPLSLTN